MKNKELLVMGVLAFITVGYAIAQGRNETPVDPIDPPDPNPSDNTLDTNRPKGVDFATFNKSFGNIRNAGRKYKGEISPKKNIYKKFSAWKYGAAAMVAHLQRYINGTIGFGNLNTITKIINTWAPPSENDTKAYIAFVVKESGIKATTVLDWKDKATLWKVSKAMSKMESRQATAFYTEGVFNDAWEIAKTQNT